MNIASSAVSVLLGILILAGNAPAASASDPAPTLLEARKIWDAAPHNAFTDLIRFEDRWLCVFREGTGHVSPDGKIRVIASKDGADWSSLALVEHASADLRDPKIVLAPDGRLMLTAAAAWHQRTPHSHQTMAWFSGDGRTWSEPVSIGDPDLWLWRVTWDRDRAYGVGYDTAGENFVRLYSSDDGRRFDTLVPSLFSEGHPNETSLVFLPDTTCLCLLRRDGDAASGKLGLAKPPYTAWQWKDLGAKIGGPHMIRLPDGRLIAAVRLYDGGARTSLAWIDPKEGKLTECLRLPSGGDCSYAGLAWHADRLWVSYYSSHEGKTSIYLATVKLD